MLSVTFRGVPEPVVAIDLFEALREAGELHGTADPLQPLVIERVELHEPLSVIVISCPAILWEQPDYNPKRRAKFAETDDACMVLLGEIADLKKVNEIIRRLNLLVDDLHNDRRQTQTGELAGFWNEIYDELNTTKLPALRALFAELRQVPGVRLEIRSSPD